MSLLDDEPFRIVSQMGLLGIDSGVDNTAVKKSLDKQYAPLGVELNDSGSSTLHSRNKANL